MLATLKKEIRREVLGRRDSLSVQDRIDFSRQIFNNLRGLEEFKKAKVIHFFLSVKSEVLTEEAVRKTLLMGKDVVVPVLDKKHRCILLSKLNDYNSELMIMPHGIHEPGPEFFRPVHVKDVDLMALPGVAFDKTGHRLGYGAGYYDRLLETEQTRPLLAALAFELQIVDEIPVGSHDVEVDMIVTEERIIKCR